MYIDKGFKKERKNKKIFILFMALLSTVLVLSIYLLDYKSSIIISLLILTEALIFVAIILKIDNEILKFSFKDSKLKIKKGILRSEDILFCDKIKLVHVEKSKEEIEIIVITTVKQRNNTFKLVDNSFINKHPGLMEEYFKIREQDNRDSHYFKIINKGGLKKYLLLDMIYKTSLKAVFTNSAIECIKISRMINEI